MPLDAHPLGDHEAQIGTGRRLGLVVLRDHAAHDHAGERVEQAEHGVLHGAADILEIDVDAVRAGLGERRRADCWQRWSTQSSKPSVSCTHRHLSGPPAMPTTRAPARLAIWPATEPTAPEAAETTTVSPGFGWPMSFMPE